MKAPLGLMPAAVRCQPYPFAGITQVRFLRSPRPVGASQPGLPRSNRSAPSSRCPIRFKARVAPAGEAVNLAGRRPAPRDARSFYRISTRR